MSTLIYLASPYTHPDKDIEEERFDVVNRVTAKLICKGLFVFSPISYSHSILTTNNNILNIPSGWEFWSRFDKLIIEKCGELWVLVIPGWVTSKGIAAEVKFARSLDIPVKYLDPESLNLYTEVC